MILDVHPRLSCFSRMRSEGFPSIVWGSGAWTVVRLEWLVASSSGRRRVVVASLIPCLWGKLQNLSFSKVSKQVVVLRGRRGTLSHSNLFDNVSKVSKLEEVSAKCSFCCAHVSRLESLVLLWRRRVYKESCKTSPFRRFSSRLSCQFVAQSSTGKCFVQAFEYKVVLGSALCKLCSTK